MGQNFLQKIERFAKKLQKDLQINDFSYEVDSDGEMVNLQFPCEREEAIEISFEELEYYIDELETIKFYDDSSKVTTESITQQVVKITSKESIYALLYLGLLGKYNIENIRIDIVQNPILIGIAASHFKEYDEYNPPCSSHMAVQIMYFNGTPRLSDIEEKNLIKVFMFELANSHKINFQFSNYYIKRSPNIEDVRLEVLQSTEFIYNIPVEDYNVGMDMFINANQNLSSDLKFLSYYKIFEHFAPVKARIEAYDSMRLKLSSSNAILLDANFISTVFELARNYDKSINDSELIKSLINSAFDLVDIYESLPLSIRKKVNQIELKYSYKKETKDRVINELGNILYQTRNSIVHAKSNYELKGLECKLEDLDQLNEFMHKASFSIVKWYSGLPKHLKINIG
jgi:hypothetical protein